MLEKIIQNTFAKVTTTAVAISLLQGCIVRQTYSWKNEGLAETRYEEVKKETENESQYEINARVSDNGVINVNIEKREYTINYDILRPIQIQQQQEYGYGRSKVGAVIANFGLGLSAVGLILEAMTDIERYCEKGYTYYNREDKEEWGDEKYICEEYYPGRQGTPTADVFLGTGIVTFGLGGLIWIPQKERKTQDYRTIEVPLETTETRRIGEILKTTTSALNIPFTADSDSFLINGKSSSYQGHTDSQGNATVQLTPTDPGFAFTQERLANIAYAQQLRKAGYSSKKYLPLLQQNATQVQYTVTIQTQATDGENARIDVPVHGFTVPPEAMQQIIMGL